MGVDLGPEASALGARQGDILAYGAQESSTLDRSRHCGRHVCESGIDAFLVKTSPGAVQPAIPGHLGR